MKTDKTTVFQLFDQKRRFVVPLFQRGYVWSLESQWQPLWADILDLAAAVGSSTGNASTPTHFMGAIVLNQTQAGVNYVPIIEIIDGQQRLTTLFVFLTALRDEVGEQANRFIAAELDKLTRNDDPLKEHVERYKVWPTAAYQKDIQDIAESGSVTELLRRNPSQFRYRKWDPPRPPLVEAYEFFATQIRSLIAGTMDEAPEVFASLNVAERIESLHQAVTRGLQLVTIELEADDDAQVIFETLNARGAPLQAGDLVRNFVFLDALRRNEDIDTLYASSWREFDEAPDPAQPRKVFWKQEERQGRLKRSRFDLFLFHFVSANTGDEFTIEQLYGRFKQLWDRWGDPPTALNELVTSSQVYSRLLAPETSNRFGQFASRMRILDTTTMYPLVLWLAKELGVHSHAFEDCVVALESFVIRRAVCGLTQKAYNRVFLELLRALRESDVPPSREMIEMELGSHSGESVSWPDDDTFYRHLSTAPTYLLLRPRQTLMLLEAIERHNKSAFAEDITIRSPLSVEHVHPQQGTEEDWPLETLDGEAPDAARLRTDLTIQGLGNLTLLTQPLNSSVSRGAYALKRPAITQQSLLSLNAYFQNQDVWSLADIQKRAAVLAKSALEIWPAPKAS